MSHYPLGRTGAGAGRALRSARELRGLSQRELAELAGTGQSHISEVETGATDVYVSTLARLFEALDLELVITAAPIRSESKS